MIYRLIDKCIIVVFSVAALFLIFGGNAGASSYANHSGALWIGAILGAVVFAMTTEVLRSRYIGALLAIAACAATWFIPEISAVLPVCAYGLFSDKDAEESFYQFHEKKNFRDGLGVLLEKKYMWVRILLLAGCIAITIRNWMCVLVFGAALLAVKTAYMHQHDVMVTDKFDTVRYDAQQSQRLKDEISQNMDMQIRNATLQERNRIAREIHDNVGHQLTRAVVQLQAISVMNEDEKTKPYLESVSSTVNEAMTNIRRSVHELHDDSIDLSIGIHEIASVLKDRFEVTVSTSIESPVPNDIKNAILGIFKEGVTNIAKHSNGKKVRLEVVENVTFWRVLVSDDGKNSVIEYSRPSDFAALEGEHGIGLYNINSRAVSVGGRTSIRGGKDGFHITVTIPKKN